MKSDPTARDERILSCLRRSISGWIESCSIAYTLRAPEAEINTSLTRLLAEGKVQRRILTGSRRAVEWRVASKDGGR